MSKLLKKQREDLGTDIKEVASNTRIKESWLRSIEDENYEKLPIEVYTRGYIKEYAKYLDLPIETALAPYEKYLELQGGAKGKKTDSIREVTEKPEQKGQRNVSRQVDHGAAFCKEVKTQTETPRLGSSQQEGRVKRNRLIWKGLLLFIVFLAIIYQFVSSKTVDKEIRFDPITSEEPIRTEPIRTEPIRTEPALKPEASIAPANAPITEEIKIPKHNKHLLEIAATDTTWVWVVMDDAEKRESLMKPGDTATYEANKTFSVIVGNAGGATIKFDGKELPAGNKGEVLRLTLPEKKTLTPQSEALGQSIKKLPKPSLPAHQDDPDQAKDDPLFSHSPAKPAATSRP